MRIAEVLLEAQIKQIQIPADLKIGWWLDRDPVIFYHGTHEDNLPNIEKYGLTAPTEGSTAGKVSLAIDPMTAHGFASMSAAGGEHKYRQMKKGFRNPAQHKLASTTPHENRIVLVINLPRSYVLQIMKAKGFEARGHMEELVHRLDDKNEYERLVIEGGMKENLYYARTEIRVPEVKPQNIIGYTRMQVKPKAK